MPRGILQCDSPTQLYELLAAQTEDLSCPVYNTDPDLARAIGGIQQRVQNRDTQLCWRTVTNFTLPHQQMNQTLTFQSELKLEVNEPHEGNPCENVRSFTCIIWKSVKP